MGNSNMWKSNNGNMIKSSSGKIVPQIEESSSDTLQKGTLIDNRYRVVNLIGEGGMGAVYQVTDEQGANNQFYALKANNLVKQDTMQETTLLKRLSHAIPHIVRPMAFGHDDALDTDYIVMEYIIGESFENICERIGYLTENECLVVAYEVCQALEALEVCQVLHCDIKPSNIMLDENGIVFLTDFGSAISLKRQDETGRRPSPPPLPQNGTPLYESPEQWRRKPSIDSRTDIYSLGATLYDLATGRHAFPGETTNEVFAYRAKHAVASMTPRRANPSLSREFSELIMNMMAVDPEDRPGTSSYLLDALVELGCPKYEEDRTEIMQNLLTREPSTPLPPPRKDISGIIQNILRIIFIILIVIMLIWICFM